MLAMIANDWVLSFPAADVRLKIDWTERKAFVTVNGETVSIQKLTGRGAKYNGITAPPGVSIVRGKLADKAEAK